MKSDSNPWWRKFPKPGCPELSPKARPSAEQKPIFYIGDVVRLKDKPQKPRKVLFVEWHSCCHDFVYIVETFNGKKRRGRLRKPMGRVPYWYADQLVFDFEFQSAVGVNPKMKLVQFEILEGRGVTAPFGFRAGSARGGIKTHGDDVAILLADEGATCAAMFTSNQVKAAPVLVSQSHLNEGAPRAIVVNAGNANCATGIVGLQNAREMAELCAKKLDISRQQVLVCSTGIIGHQLPMDKVNAAIEAIKLQTGNDEAVARAFMTTDLVPKFFAASAQIGGRTVIVGGQCKGVGMIGPDLVSPPKAAPAPHATMLAFLTTDAKIERDQLQTLLERAAARTFNSVTVDGDTSTNDTAILLASGASGVAIDTDNEAEFSALLEFVARELAKKIARDGEGATKLIEISVSGAQTEADAKKIALTIANSPLVKTAIFGRDPNWGRIAMAAGRAGVAFSPSDLSFSLGEVPLFKNGEPVAFDLKEAEAQLEGNDVLITLDLKNGDANWTAWTCDFSYEYVKINAEYHT